MRIEIVRTDAEQPWHARMKGDNGKIVWTTGENYVDRRGAEDAIAFAANGFGVKGVPSMDGPPGNRMLVFRTSIGIYSTGSKYPATAEQRFPIFEVDERTQK